MNQSGNFSLISTEKPTNKDLVVAFQPAQNVQSYSYIVYKDGKEFKAEAIIGNNSSNIYLSGTGKYQIKVKVNKDAKEEIVSSGIYVIDKENPILKIENTSFEIYKGTSFSDKTGVSAMDNYSGDVTNFVVSNYDELDLNSVGKHTLTYTVSDEAGNTTSREVTVNVLDSGMHLYVLQAILIVVFAIISILFIRFREAVRLERRIGKFAIEPIREGELSAFDKFIEEYHEFTEKLAQKFEKSIVAKKYALKLEKYTVVSSFHKTGMQILIGKFIVSLIFALLATFAKTIQLELITYYEIVLPMVIGFFLLDIIYWVKYKLYRNKLENDLLAAITIMNNAFKSGRSITQAIDIVTVELDGTISNEFKKMSLELSYGLGIETVFKRFAERVQIEEVNYLTASLTILNQTGGNIIKVFSAIEKSLFNKKKLRLELQSLTGSSKIIVYVLFAVPFLFILFISIISPDYFEPFFTTKLGILLTIFMIIYYVIFIITVKKIMKVVI